MAHFWRGVALAVLAVAALGTEAQAGRVKDESSSVSFVPPPYFKTDYVAGSDIFHYALTPPDQSVKITTGAQFDRKSRPVAPLDPAEVKALCARANAMIGKQYTLRLAKRYVLATQNGAECQFADARGRTLHWMGAPVATQLVLFMAEWPQAPSADQLNTYRMFLGSVRIF
jgi:hypothetical protein